MMYLYLKYALDLIMFQGTSCSMSNKISSKTSHGNQCSNLIVQCYDQE